MSDTRTVLKWSMAAPVEKFAMPPGSVVLDVATQNGLPTLWTLGPTPSGVTEQREFIGYGTGHPMWEENLTYVGTAHDVYGDGLVFHIFERRPAEVSSD